MTDLSALESLYFAALEKPLADRSAFLDAACGGDRDLRARVERLLAAQPKVGGFLDAPATSDLSPAGRTATFGIDAPATANFPGKDEHLGAILGGKYKLMEEIGEGGMGQVFMAQQTEPVKRAVAVKVIKAGMDSKAVLARFDAERQALAMMDHPNIAKVLDAGTTESGRPYFVMELVKGTPITQYCDDRKLTPRQRLELFVPICQAIQHAHQKGIIHRDIKPSNVIVAMYDDKPVPKVIDFGVAKATGSSLTDQTLMTGFGAVVGTPEYMSPEQANLNNLDIDTRSDVYSLGVLLYELLTGSTPVDRKSFGKAALLEILRMVREVEAPKPSAKLSTIDTLPNVAANRGTEPAKLSKLMKGELDWVVMKALDKDRTRRYDTANAMARDIQRYLADEIVEARPPSTGYRLKKYVRRNKAQVLAGSAILAAILTGTGIAIWQAKVARTAERDAIAAKENEAEQRAEAEKKEAAAKDAEAATKEVLKFISDKVFAAARPVGSKNGLGKDVKLRQALDAAEASISESFANRPHVELEIREVLASTYYALGEYDAGDRQNELWLEICEQKLDRIHPNYPDQLSHWRSRTTAYDSAKEEPARKRIESAYQHYLRSRGPDDEGTLELALTLAFSLVKEPAQHMEVLNLVNDVSVRIRLKHKPDSRIAFQAEISSCNLRIKLGQTDDLIPLVKDILRRMRIALPPNDSLIFYAINCLAGLYEKTAQYDEAIRCFEQGKELQQKYGTSADGGERDWDEKIAIAYFQSGRPAEAVPILEVKLPKMIEQLGYGHQAVNSSAINLSHSYNHLHRFEDTIRMMPPFLEASIKHYGPDFRPTRLLRSNLFAACLSLQRADAEIHLKELCESVIRDFATGDDPINTIVLEDREWFNQLLPLQRVMVTKRFLEALEQASQQPAWLKDRRKSIPGLQLRLQHDLTEAYVAAGQPELAKPVIESFLKGIRTVAPPQSLSLAFNLRTPAELYNLVRDFPAAERLQRESFEIFQKLQPDSSDLAASKYYLSAALLAMKRYEEAEKEALDSLAWFRKSEGPNGGPFGIDAINVLNLLELIYRGWDNGTGRPDRIESMRLEFCELAKSHYGPESKEYTNILSLTGLAMLELQRWEAAEKSARTSLTIREKIQPDIWNTFNSRSMLGGALLGQKKYADAEPLLIAGYEGMKQREKTIPAEGKLRLPEALDRLVQFYTESNKPDEVEKWKAERAKFREVLPSPKPSIKK